MKRLLWFVLIAIFSLNAAPGTLPGTGSLTTYFQQLIGQSKQRLLACNSLLVNFDKILDTQNIRYHTHSVINLSVDDPVARGSKIGISFDFGDAGVGNLSAFDGFSIKFMLDALPDSFKPPFESFFAKILFDATQQPDPAFVDPSTGISSKMVYRSTPVMEFILKAAFLMRDVKDGIIDQSDARTQLMLLIFRLSQVPGITSFDQVIKELPDVMEPLFKVVNFGSVNGLDYVRALWLRCMEIFNYNLQDTTRTYSTAKDAPALVTAFMALGFNFVVECEKARSSFIATPDGAKAWEEYLVKKDKAAFNKKITAYATARSTLIKNAGALLLRVQKIRNAVITTLRPLLEPLLDQYGIPFDLIVPPTKEESAAAEVQAEADALAAEIDMLLADDALTSVDYEIIEEDDASFEEQDDTFMSDSPSSVSPSGAASKALPPTKDFKADNLLQQNNETAVDEFETLESLDDNYSDASSNDEASDGTLSGTVEF